ncbi:MAG: hypothetical protein M4579_006622 [Chaenotheca gracillima]|nr:MAG: hypothetical protein M4579_006622 [Chaenotheca gracillima]
MSEHTVPTVAEPFPISLIADRYLIFDVDTITYIRREYHLCGVFIGSLPQVPQQNVFLGVPLELMPEEARLLVEKGAAYVIDDVQQHAGGLAQLSKDEKQAFTTVLDKEGKEAAKGAEIIAGGRKAKALNKIREKKQKQEVDLIEKGDVPDLGTGQAEEDTLFSAGAPRPSSSASSHTISTAGRDPQAYQLTPTTSYPPFNPTEPSPTLPLPKVPTSYPLFAYLNSRGYFLSPGLRFGCQYLAYPGDPLRFHSHFLGVGLGWDEEIDLLDLVGGGRLGTGVKKGFLFGGTAADDPSGRVPPPNGVRTFCIEWSGM